MPRLAFPAFGVCLRRGARFAVLPGLQVLSSMADYEWTTEATWNSLTVEGAYVVTELRTQCSGQGDGACVRRREGPRRENEPALRIPNASCLSAAQES